MITVQACILYIVSGTSIGWVSDGCYVEENTNIVTSAPDIVYRVNELPTSQKLYLVEDTYVNYWTTPSIRITFGSFFGYRSHHHRHRRPARRHHTQRAHRRHHPRGHTSRVQFSKRPVRGRRITPTRRVGVSVRHGRKRVKSHRRPVRKARKVKATRNKTKRVVRRSSHSSKRRTRRSR